MLLFRSVVCAAALGCALPALADTVWLKNGDRLTGTIKAFDGGKLVLQTPYSGELSINWSSVATLESDQALLVKQSQYDGEVARSLQSAEEGHVTLANGERPRTVALSSIHQMLRPKPLVADLGWKGAVDVAFNYKDGASQTEDHNVKLATSARHGRWRHSVGTEYNRELSNDVEVEDNYNLEYALDHFVSEHWFWQGRFDYRRDNLGELERKRQVGSGPGYQFWDTELGSFGVASLLNRTDHDYANGDRYSFPSAALKWKYNRYLLGKRFELYSTGELGKPLDKGADYSLDAEAGVRYRITDWAWLNLRAEKDVIKGGEDDADFNEQRYLFGVGVGW